MSYPPMPRGSSYNPNRFLTGNTEVMLPSGQQASVPLRLPAQQSRNMNHRTRYFQVSASMPPTTFFSSPSQTPFQLTIPRGAVQSINCVDLYFDVTVANAATQLTPMCTWFNRLNLLWEQSANPFYSVTRDGIIKQTLALLRDQDKGGYLEQMNFSREPAQDYCVNGALQQVGTQRYRLPLLGSFFYSEPYFFSNAKQNLILQLISESTICMAGSGSNANISVANMFVGIESWDMVPDELQIHLTEYNSAAHMTTFLQPIELQGLQNQTITAGQQSSFDMSALSTAKYAGFLVSFLPSTATNQSNGQMQYVDLGSNGAGTATIDVIRPDGTSLLTYGSSPMDAGWLRNGAWNFHFSNRLPKFQSIYALAVVPSLMAAYQGRIEGFLEISNTNSARLAIVPGPAAVSGVQTLTPSAAPASGSFSIRYKQSETQPLIYTSTGAQIAAAINALDSVVNEGFTVAVSGALSTTPTVTFSANWVNSGPNSLLIVHSQGLEAAASASCSVTASLTTQPVRGWVTGVYSIFVQALRFQQLISLAGLTTVQNV